ncbi:MAG: hypothetical protein ACSHW1_02140 [Yoonia sp.]|uniref:hypothetical protein n=1 Tax=Yoonia sp. TaxID=2212373 RepID=UPI003EF678DE
MQSWLAYGGAFACAMGTAIVLSVFASYLALSRPIWGFGPLLLFGFVVPIAAAVFVFGLTYGRFTGYVFDRERWLVVVAVSALAAIVAAFLVVVQVNTILVFALLVAVLFVAGAAMHRRNSND